MQKKKNRKCGQYHVIQETIALYQDKMLSINDVSLMFNYIIMQTLLIIKCRNVILLFLVIQHFNPNIFLFGIINI